jgi:uncharacterized protein (AIM24 family)
MSTLKTNNVQVGQSVTATNNFTIYQPSTPDGTVRIGVGNSGATTADVITANSSGNVGVGTSSPAGRFHARFDAGAGDGYTGKFAFSTTDQALFVKTYWQSGVGQHTTLEASNLANSVVTDLRLNGNTLQFQTGSTERARIDSSGNFQFNSGYGSVATAYACRAWVNFNGTGTVAIRASGNVSSITDNGTGDYTVNFTNAMPDANYAPVCGTSPAIAISATAGSWYFGVKTDASGNPTTKTSAACRVTTAYLTGPASIADAPELYATFFR